MELARLLFTISVFATYGASAATLNVVGGELLGASGVIVGGASYDVAFLDGTCIDLYSGCDEVSDFTFQTSAGAELASAALLDQVFLDTGLGFFDLQPELTNGCTSVSLCLVDTPYTVGASFVRTWEAQNAAGASDPSAIDALFAQSFDTTPNGVEVFAVWTLVPEPSTALLMALGLGWLGPKRAPKRGGYPPI